MLLTEGWDCPSVDCVIVLRPTKVRGLFCQMVGRGTRLSPGKKDLLLIDFLWLTDKHELCHPASLICEDNDVAQQLTKNLEDKAGVAIDLEEAEKMAAEDVIQQREDALAKKLAEMRRRKKKLVDPLQYEITWTSSDENVVTLFNKRLARSAYVLRHRDIDLFRNRHLHGFKRSRILVVRDMDAVQVM